MADRKPIGKSLRFKVFKRDSFSCQYCGATPPAAVLEVDHINPVSKGGGNGIDNLITACFNCNRGKAASLLSDIPKALQDRAEEVAEREAQIKGYNKILKAKSDRIDREAWEVAARLERCDELLKYSRSNLMSIKRFLERLPMAHVLEAADIANARWYNSGTRHFRYFCGVCWGKIREQGNG